MTKLCLQLSVELDRYVVDKTEIAGAFDIPFDWSPSESSSDAAVDTGSPLASAKKSLAKVGLVLARGKAARPFLVIDRVERPSVN